MGIWREDIEAALEGLGGQATLDDIYSAVKLVRGERLPPSWQAIVRRELEYNSSDSESFQKRYDLFYSVAGIGRGLWGLRRLVATPTASDAGDPPLRINTQVYRILRDTKLARALKRLHDDKCQVCGVALRISAERTYSEAHHIKPLGTPHNGPDTKGNIIVLCPNHHALIDLGGMKLSLSQLRAAPGHTVEPMYVQYHNEVIVP